MYNVAESSKNSIEFSSNSEKLPGLNSSLGS